MLSERVRIPERFDQSNPYGQTIETTSKSIENLHLQAVSWASLRRAEAPANGMRTESEPRMVAMACSAYGVSEAIGSGGQVTDSGGD